MTQVESLVLDIEHPAISWQAVSPSSLDGPFLNEATGRYIPTEGAQAFLIALPQPSTCPVDRYRAVLRGGQDAESLRRRAGGHRSGEGQRLERRGTRRPFPLRVRPPGCLPELFLLLRPRRAARTSIRQDHHLP